MMAEKEQAQHGLPFQVDIPNKETARILKESEQGANIVKSKDMNELFKKLDLDES